MSDLRTRIAKAIADAQFAFDEGDPYNGPEDAEVLADAVISELKLTILGDGLLYVGYRND